MSEAGYDELLATVTANLTKNGYPDKRVSLPLDRMYEVAYSKGLNFNKALQMLKDRGIDHEKTSTKIIFAPLVTPSDVAPADAASPDMAQMMAKASEMLKNLSPEQLAEMQRMVAGMSETERAAMMDRAKNFK